jgi:hypothetical protein
MNTLLKSYDVMVRLPMTAAARNAGATGRTHWWAYAGRINARSKRHACALMRKGEWAYAEKLRAFSR